MIAVYLFIIDYYISYMVNYIKDQEVIKTEWTKK